LSKSVGESNIDREGVGVLLVLFGRFVELPPFEGIWQFPTPTTQQLITQELLT